ncbi:unnamed protein product [Darwinula stevensoni]|uniref:Chromatin assembly factor 1 subunit A n=1 Tax=Darwinula stevensoni TaxID=69355 RepID=A0A7R8XES9_9CRUS|nr:unnamed protein product [Darwinula stevensoni]CAG0894525.1 unnamed protein product [Darwinula stevensoni]
MEEVEDVPVIDLDQEDSSSGDAKRHSIGKNHKQACFPLKMVNGKATKAQGSASKRKILENEREKSANDKPKKRLKLKIEASLKRFAHTDENQVSTDSKPASSVNGAKATSSKSFMESFLKHVNEKEVLPSEVMVVDNEDNKNEREKKISSEKEAIVDESSPVQCTPDLKSELSPSNDLESPSSRVHEGDDRLSSPDSSSYDCSDSLNDSVVSAPPDTPSEKEVHGTPSARSRSESLKSSTRKAKGSLEETPKSVAKDSVTPQDCSEGKNTPQGSSRKKLTPKQLSKKIESEKKRKEKLRAKQEMEEKKAEEKAEKERLRKEKLEQKEFQRREKEREKEEKKLQREAEIRKKEEEKKQKEEERRQKEEERRQKEEEKRMKEEEKKKQDEEKKKMEEEKKNKIKKAQAAFASFFVKRGPSETVMEVSDSDNVEGNFRGFQVKEDMRLAPVHRNELSQRQKSSLDAQMTQQSGKDLYLKQLKSGHVTPGTSGPTWLLDPDEDVVILEEDKENFIITHRSDGKRLKAKLFQFEENNRPPYWGTWQKTSTAITGRRPFYQDKAFLDYEVDSDDEWEEGVEAGESLSGSDDEESEDDYEIDNDFFVPHGYLSDEEGEKDEDDKPVDPELQKAKLKLKAAEFEAKIKQKTEKLHPRLIGCCFDHQTNSVHEHMREILSAFKAVFLSERPISVAAPPKPLTPDVSITPDKGKRKALSSVEKNFPEAAVSLLIKLVHENPRKGSALIREFQQYWVERGRSEIQEHLSTLPQEEQYRLPNRLSKRKIYQKFKECAMRCRPKESGPFAWHVPKAIREKYGLGDAAQEWDYVTDAAHAFPSSNNQTNRTQSSSKPSTPSIKKFTCPVEANPAMPPASTEKKQKMGIKKFLTGKKPQKSLDFKESNSAMEVECIMLD